MKAHLKSPSDFKISACTIAKNEEKAIAKSINSYKKYVDEIIVVDTGSTDDTVKIAESLGARVLHFEWCDDFAAAKNTALDAAAGDWIIFPDADEYFADNTCENLRAVILEAVLEQKNAIGCRLENIDSDNGGTGISDIFQIRVFKAGARYQYPIHEEIHNPEGVHVLSVNKSYFYLKHTGYSKSVSAKKSERNLEILLSAIKSEKDESRVIIDYSYISDSYFGMGQYKEARKYAEKFIEQSKDKNIRITGCETKPYSNIINSLEMEKAEPETIEPYVKKFESEFPDCADASYLSGHNCMRSYRFNEALRKFDKALKLSENCGVYNDSVGANKSSVYNYCGVCQEALLHPVKAMDWYIKAFQENDNNQPALFNLLRIVRGTPKKEFDSLAESLYLGASQKKQTTVMSALMGNYMTPQLIKCYAAYRSDTKEIALNAEVTAFIMAGEGKYASAANFFLLSHKSNGNSDTAMRSLLCAALSGDKELIAQALEICGSAQKFALGFAEKPELTIDDIYDISAVYIESDRLGRIEFLKGKMNKLSRNLDNRQLMRLSEFLSDGFAFEAALCAARHAEISAESVFMQGYCFYRMRRLNEAVELLLLAKHMGYLKPAFDEIYGNIMAIREKNDSEPPTEKKKQLKSQIEREIEAGDFDGAGGNIETYMRITEPDTEIFTALATVLYYHGEYKRAAVAAECGLLKDENNFDLLYNAGCIYEKLGDSGCAKEMYLKALKNCRDSGTANELKQALGVKI